MSLVIMKSLKDESDQGVFIISCDLCEKDIGTERPNAMGTPTNNLSGGVLVLGTETNERHICESCRYAGAVDKDTITRVKTIKEQLARAHMTANKIQTFKDAPQWAKRISYKVRMDLDECIEKLKRVLDTLEKISL